MKKLLSLFVAITIVISCITTLVFAESSILLTYDLTSDGSNEVTAKKGDIITVTYTIKRTDSQDAYTINAIQNEIKYDTEFFDFVDNSIIMTKGEGRLLEKFEGERVYMNDINTSYDATVEVGTFKLRVIASSGSGKVESTECIARDSSNGDITVTPKDLTVTIGDSSGTDNEGDDDGNNGNNGNDGNDGNGGGGGGGGGGGAGIGGGATIDGDSNPADNSETYTNDIFGNKHPNHIGYINGYPDGTVRPDGQITREEIAAILYRITVDNSKEDFSATGEAFADVEADRWSAVNIEYMADKEVILGYPTGDFKPENNLTRAEFAALIFRFTGIDKAKEEKEFIDLDNSHWAYNEILALTDYGLVQGYEDSTFRPENNITRAEVMTVINKLLGRKPLESYVKSLEFNPYNDLFEDEWYYVTVLEATITHNYLLNDTGYEYKWEDWK